MSKNRPATAGAAASSPSGAATPDPIRELAAELFARHWVPKPAMTNEHLAGLCLEAAAEFYAAEPKDERQADAA